MDGFDDRPSRPDRSPSDGPRDVEGPVLHPELLPPSQPGFAGGAWGVGAWPQEEPEPPPPRWRLALVLFALTFFTVTTLGPAFWGWTRTDLTTDLFPFLEPGIVKRVWTEPELLKLGLSLSVPALVILLAHELGHYLACRRYRIAATLPYFLPTPVMLGTLGAFIRIKAPIRNRKELFDVGIAGPIAGFVALIPFLLYGVANSQPAPLPEVLRPGESVLLPGRSLAIDLVARLFHGPLGDDMILNLHPFALAAWFGLLATSINLIPLGQLDGGHILYAVSRRWQRRLAPLVWVGLALAGFLWQGWWVWCVLSVVFGLFHPRVHNEAAPLGRGRQILAVVGLLILLLSFIPRGIIALEGALPDDGSGEAGEWVELNPELQKSAMSVTGPSLTSDTSMWARNRPVSTR